MRLPLQRMDAAMHERVQRCRVVVLEGQQPGQGFGGGGFAGQLLQHVGQHGQLAGGRLCLFRERRAELADGQVIGGVEQPERPGKRFMLKAHQAERRSGQAIGHQHSHGAPVFQRHAGR